MEGKANTAPALAPCADYGQTNVRHALEATAGTRTARRRIMYRNRYAVPPILNADRKGATAKWNT